jgi:hypothetical protein
MERTQKEGVVTLLEVLSGHSLRSTKENRINQNILNVTAKIKPQNLPKKNRNVISWTSFMRYKPSEHNLSHLRHVIMFLVPVKPFATSPGRLKGRDRL